jgi:serpin B
MLIVPLFTTSCIFADVQSVDIKPSVIGNNTFALDLYATLKKKQGNLFLSPYSISSALAMTYGGARGDTAEEMARALHFSPGADGTHSAFSKLGGMFDNIQKKGQVELQIANSLWPRKGHRFLPEYLELIKHHYGESIVPVDYVNATEEACKIINAWVEDKTEERIRNLIHPGALSPSTTLVLVNAIYFKGSWASRFDPERTADSEFTVSSDVKTHVPMMYQKGKFGYGKINGAQFLELPYAGKALSMFIILPEEREGLSGIENQLTMKNLDSWLSRLSEQDIDVYLPKFKITWGTFKLNESLQALGMRKAFAGADFSGMDGTKNLSIDSVLHKAFIEVNEEGTEAAAATAVVMRKSLPRINMFKADHPFLFLIRDNATKSILFLGRVLDPGEGTSPAR